MSRLSTRLHRRAGQFNYPTRNFARLISSVSKGAGLYLERPRFICSATCRISSTPSLVRWTPFSIFRRTCLNFLKSTFFPVFKGCFMKNGPMISRRWSALRTAISHPIAMVHANFAASEIALECMQNLYIALVLYNGEFRQDLESCSHFRVGINTNVKTPFTVHEACNRFGLKLHWMLLNVLVSEGFRYIRIFPADCPHVHRIVTEWSQDQTSTG